MPTPTEILEQLTAIANVLGDALGSRPWSLLLALVGAAYGLWGFTGLGVALDSGLLVGATALLALALRAPQNETAPPPQSPQPAR